MRVKHAKDVLAQIVKTGDKTTIQVLLSAKEGPHFAMRLFITSSLTLSSSLREGMSIEISSPSSTMAIMPPTCASGEMCPMHGP